MQTTSRTLTAAAAAGMTAVVMSTIIATAVITIDFIHLIDCKAERKRLLTLPFLFPVILSSLRRATLSLPMQDFLSLQA